MFYIGGRCGPSYNLWCPGNECCSTFQHCGTTAGHCGNGCRSTYGRCDVSPPLPSPRLELVGAPVKLTKASQIIVPGSSFPTTSNQYTIMFWLKLDSISPSWTNILHWGSNNGNRGPAIFVYPGGTKIHYRSATDSDWNFGIDMDGNIKIGKWNHITYSFGSSGTLTGYLNGVLKSQTNAGRPPIIFSNENMRIPNPWEKVDGQINVAYITWFPLVLSPQDINNAINQHNLAL